MLRARYRRNRQTDRQRERERERERGGEREGGERKGLLCSRRLVLYVFFLYFRQFSLTQNPMIHSEFGNTGWRGLAGIRFINDRLLAQVCPPGLSSSAMTTIVSRTNSSMCSDFFNVLHSLN